MPGLETRSARARGLQVPPQGCEQLGSDEQVGDGPVRDAGVDDKRVEEGPHPVQTARPPRRIARLG